MPTASPSVSPRPEFAAAKPGEVLVATGCWSCGTPVYKMVRRHRHLHPHLSWNCAQCDVTWSAVGLEVTTDPPI